LPLGTWLRSRSARTGALSTTTITAYELRRGARHEKALGAVEL
jgi:hypothetical protein